MILSKSTEQISLNRHHSHRGASGFPLHAALPRVQWLAAGLLWVGLLLKVPVCHAQELVLQPTGQLSWTPQEGTHLYSVEWASRPEGPWYPDWTGLMNLRVHGTNSVSVDIPMFFRVYTVTNATLTNWIGLPDTGHVNVTDGTPTGQANGAYDGLDSTAFGARRFRNADGTTSCEVDSTHHWSTPITVQSVRTKVSATPVPLGNFPKHRMRFEILLRTGGEWQSIYLDDAGDRDGTGVETVRVIQLEKRWTNITGIRVVAHAEAYSFSGIRRQEVAVSIYEVEAWGY